MKNLFVGIVGYFGVYFFILVDGVSGVLFGVGSGELVGSLMGYGNVVGGG